jgi:HSP20 family molecular chaperone IbpA
VTVTGEEPGPVKKVKKLNYGSGIMQTGNSKNTDLQEIMEPVTTFCDEGKFIHLILELPGIAEEKIRIDLEKTTITIVASDSSRRYKKEIFLPDEVIFAKKRFSDGKLSLTLEKKGPDHTLSTRL